MQIYTLRNKMKVVLAPSKGTDTVTVLLMVRVGSRYEYKAINGASHFLEHLLFKGTARRPTAQHISRALDKIGADFNAFTDKHLTGYYVKADRHHVGVAVDILEDMVFHSKFDTRELNRERTVVIEEINMYRDMPARHVEDLLEEVLFSGNTLAWNIAGSPKTMREMKKTDLMTYFDRFYDPSNMVCVVAGNIDKTTRALIEKKFGKPKSRATSSADFATFKLKEGRDLGGRIKVQFKQTAQVQLAIGFPSFGITDVQNPTVHLLSVVLGGNMSSRLFTQVRERKGLAYSINAGNYTYDDVGVFTIRAGLDKTRMRLATKTILREIEKMAKSGVSESELAEAKTFVHGQISLRMEDSQNRAQWFAKQSLFYPRAISPQAYLKKIEAVTIPLVKQVAREILNRDRMCLAVIGPYKNTEDFRKKVDV